MENEQELQQPNYSHYTGTEQDCLAYNDEVKEQKGYSGSTTDWAMPMPHPSNGSFAIKREPSVYTSIETLTGVMELDETWSSEVNPYQ